MKDEILKILTENFKANHMEYQNALNKLLNLHDVSKCCFCRKEHSNADKKHGVCHECWTPVN